MSNIDWAAVEARQAMLAAGQRAQIIDTRPRHYSTRARDILDGAVWRDPEHVDEWIGTQSKEVPVVTFCVYGFHIGCQSAATLRNAGFDARYMPGGHYAWKTLKESVNCSNRHAVRTAGHDRAQALRGPKRRHLIYCGSMPRPGAIV